jgi:glycosyltransferase 2 family protein
MNAELRRKFLWSLLLALLVYIALVFYADWRALTTALADFPWMWLPAILGLTLLNYIGRLIKWHWYLRIIGVEIGPGASSRIFGVGMLMVMTPGKVGEFLKSYMVKNVTGTPMSITAPVVLAERMTDGLAMLILAGVGLFAFQDATARLVAVTALLAILAIIAVIQVRPLAMWALRFGEKLPLVNRFAHSLYSFYESSYLLLRPRNLLIAIGIGIASWLCEGFAFYLVLVGMGLAPTWELALISIFIFSISTVVGALIPTPGGLGGTEGSLVALSVQLLDMTRTPATAAALLIRFATLWFGVVLGMISLALWPELLSGTESASSEDQAPKPAA